MGKIYKLECDDGYYYYGSTKGSLETRFVFHKKDSKSKTEKSNFNIFSFFKFFSK